MTAEQEKKAHAIMVQVNGRCLNVCRGPNDTTLEFWQVGKRLVILQIFPDAGVTHYVEDSGSTWDSMLASLQALTA